MTLVLTEDILGELIRNFESRSGGWLDDATCLEIVAASFGLDDPLALLSAVSANPPANETDTTAPAAPLAPVVAFWQSGMLTSFITDYSSRRQPVVALLSGRDSVVVMSSTPPRIFEIIANDGVFDLRDLGPGPWPGNGETRILGSFPSPAQAFDHLCQRNQWEWTHSLADDVC